MQASAVNPQLNESGMPVPSQDELPMLPVVRVEIPSDIEAVQAESLEVAVKWRVTTRQVFTWYIERGYKVMAFYRDPKSGRCFYGLIQEL